MLVLFSDSVTLTASLLPDTSGLEKGALNWSYHVRVYVATVVWFQIEQARGDDYQDQAVQELKEGKVVYWR